MTLARAKNPQAALVWCIGMLGSRILPLSKQGVEQYKAASRDENAYLPELPDTTPETIGARRHPGAASHQAAAKVLTEFLLSVL